MLTSKLLKEHISYDPENGIFTRLQDVSNVKHGQVAGGFNALGYVQIRISGHRYMGHRLAWFYMTGRWPKVLDHINGDPSNDPSELQDNLFGNLPN